MGKVLWSKTVAWDRRDRMDPQGDAFSRALLRIAEAGGDARMEWEKRPGSHLSHETHTWGPNAKTDEEEYRVQIEASDA